MKIKSGTVLKVLIGVGTLALWALENIKEDKDIQDIKKEVKEELLLELSEGNGDS